VRNYLTSISALLLAAAVLLGGCGYRLTSHPDLASPVTGRKVAVEVFVNRSYRANLGAIMAGSLAETFASRTGGRVVSAEDADLVLTGAVLGYSNNPVSYTAADTVKEYRALVTIEAVLSEKHTRKVVWKGNLAWFQDYPINAVVSLQQNSEEAAIREACDRLSLQIYERVVSGF
jgi:outer membrane lipopolysaccharide assembly protein LptE/RlpB